MTEKTNLQLDEFRTEVATIKTESINKFKTILMGTIQQWFELNPEFQAIMWKQYTPTWNDGNACTFRCGYPVAYRVYEPFRELTVNELLEVCSKGDSGIDPSDSDEGMPEDIKNIIGDPDGKDFDELITTFSDQFDQTVAGNLSRVLDYSSNMMQMCFGEPVLVVVTKNGSIGTCYFEQSY